MLQSRVGSSSREMNYGRAIEEAIVFVKVKVVI